MGGRASLVTALRSQVWVDFKASQGYIVKLPHPLTPKDAKVGEDTHLPSLASYRAWTPSQGREGCLRRSL